VSENDTTQWADLDLDPGDLEMIQNSGVTPEVAAARGYRTVRSVDEVPEVFNREQRKLVPALLIPVWGVDATTQPITYELRPAKPRPDGRTARAGVDAKTRKYEFPGKQPKRLDVPRTCLAELGNPDVPLWITEGARKADAAASRGMCAVSIAGVWAFRSGNPDGGKTELPDFEKVAFNGRVVYVAFDSDVMTKAPVRQAIVRLAGLIERRGGFVHIVVLPSGPRGEKQGLDDLIAAGADQRDLMKLVQPEFLEEEDDRKLDQKLYDWIMESYDLGQDMHHNGFAVPRKGARLVRMLGSGYPSLELEAPARFRMIEPGSPIVPRKMVKDVMPNVEYACMSAPKQELHLRTAPHKDGVVIDMGREDGAVILVTAEGWKVIEEPGADFPLFRRTHQIQPLPTPEQGGSLDELRDLVHVTDDTWPLIKGWLISSVFGWVPRPWLYHQGPQGSGKSDAAVKVISVIDPRDRIASFPKKNDKTDAGATAISTYLMGWDNLSSIPDEVSDWLCSTVTGNQDERRVLWSTSTVQVIPYMRTGVITGVGIRSFKPDLLERLVKVQFDRLPADGKRAHAELNDEFALRHARILGALLDAVSIALAHRHLVPRNLDVPRMVDYATYLKAYDLGVGESDLFGAYKANVESLLADSGEEDAVGKVVLAYMVGKTEPVKKTPEELYGELTQLRTGLNIDPESFWPKSARYMTQALNELVAALEKQVRIQTGVRTNGTRWTILTPVASSQNVTEEAGGQCRYESSVTVASLPASLPSSQLSPGVSPQSDASDASSTTSKNKTKCKNPDLGVENDGLPFGSLGVLSSSVHSVTVEESSQVTAVTQDSAAADAALEPKLHGAREAEKGLRQTDTTQGDGQQTLFEVELDPAPVRQIVATPPLAGTTTLPADWAPLFAHDTLALPVPRCRDCEAEKVGDAEMNYFRLCPNCTTGTLRPTEEA
jgi:hypothetical protein